jgi:RNA ligase (TIGR02306 family)
MRKLASIKKINKLEPIEGADKIELAHIGGWKVVVAKNVGHKVGDLVVYCEVDSFLPLEPEFEFLRKSSYKKLSDGIEGFRLKTIKLRGQISQGLIIPIRDAHEIIHRNSPNINIGLFEGLDVSEMLGIIKYEPPIPAQLAGTVKGQFPHFIPKTDEERVQNLTEEYKEWEANSSKYQFYITEKLDGSSFTCYYNNGEFGVCSRNLELKEDINNTFWKTARELKLEEKLNAYGVNIALQGELIGEGIQKNPYKLRGHTIKFFNIIDLDTREKITYDAFHNIINDLQLDTVPYIINPGTRLPNSIEDVLLKAEGKSRLNPNTEREGFVIRSKDNKISFKAISNKFLLKEK